MVSVSSDRHSYTPIAAPCPPKAEVTSSEFSSRSRPTEAADTLRAIEDSIGHRVKGSRRSTPSSSRSPRSAIRPHATCSASWARRSSMATASSRRQSRCCPRSRAQGRDPAVRAQRHSDFACAADRPVHAAAARYHAPAACSVW
jgi:hypothetical protein